MKKLAVVAAAALAIVVAILVMRGPSAPAPVSTANAAEVAEATTPVVTTALPGAPPAAAAPTTTTPTTTTAAPVASYDPFAHREEIEAIVARGDVSALPELQEIDLTKDGYVAAAAIDAVGKLAALAPEKEKREAIGTLGKWLQQEGKGKTAAAKGNVSILVDALEETKSKDAAAPLIAMLDGATQPLHIETRIVQALNALGVKSPAIARFAARVSAMQPQDEFEKALVQEALEAAQ